MVSVDRDVYVSRMENILRDQTKFKKFKIKTRILNFQVKHEKPLLWCGFIISQTNSTKSFILDI